MSKKKYALKRRKLTPAEKERWRRAVRETEAERDTIIARGRRLLREHDSIRQVFAALKDERLRQGLTLAELEQRSGIGKPALSRLENASDPNPTIATVCRVAHALGKHVKIVLADERSASR